MINLDLILDSIRQIDNDIIKIELKNDKPKENELYSIEWK